MSGRKYIVSARARAAMENELRRFPDVETGGLLLGYADASRGVSVLEATDGGYRDAVREPCCFEYDAAYVAHAGAILSELYAPPLDVVGIWHKHNQVCAVAFSRADERMHAQLTEQFAHPCLSILYEKAESSGSEEAQYEVRAFELSRSGCIDVSRKVRWQAGREAGEDALP